MDSTKLPKIIFYTDTPLFGGAEIQMLTLALELKKKGFDISLICRQSAALIDLVKELEDNQIPCFLLHSKSKNSLGIFFQLHKILKREKPDLIHSHLWNPVANKHLFFLKPFHKFKIISTEHDPFKLSFLKTLYKKFTLNLTAHILTVSKSNSDLMISLYPKISDKISVVHNGIKPIPKISSEKRLALRKKILGISSLETKVIFSAGTLHPRKGYKYLIQAYRQIAKQFPQTCLIIAGEGPQRPELEKLIKNLDLDQKIKLLGFQAGIPELIQASDLFVLPSTKEAFGLVILESFAAGTPVIASKVGGIPEIIEDGKNGLLVKPQNKDNLIKSIKKLLTNQKLADQLAAGGTKTLAKFTVEKMTNATVEVYREFLL